MARHINIPVFIPHLGCPNECVFCNQRTISGVTEFDINSVRRNIDGVLSTVTESDECEIAFFGGSFTGIDRELMLELLSIGKSYIDKGLVKSLRCSTRPDYISPDILDLLRKYGVETIELGIQSVSDAVLSACKRGHTNLETKSSCEMIISYGFSLVGQMMIGLPGATFIDEINTAMFIADIGASAARIYPTVVFNDTELRYMKESGIYQPLSLDEAVERCAAAYEIFLQRGVKLLRVGLCSSENLLSDTTYNSGPNHSAIGELVENRIFLNRISDAFIRIPEPCGKSYIISVAPNAVSKAVGQNKKNKIALIEGFSLKSLKFVSNKNLLGFDFVIEEERKNDECI